MNDKSAYDDRINALKQIIEAQYVFSTDTPLSYEIFLTNVVWKVSIKNSTIGGEKISMLWTAKPTGDMTLSILDEKGQQILCVKMLSYGTMKAGDGGERLARTMNDLSVLARFGSGQTEIAQEDLPQPEAGISPLPWSVRFDPSARRVVIFDGKKKRIAERDYPAKMDEAYLHRIVESLTDGCRLLKTDF